MGEGVKPFGHAETAVFGRQPELVVVSAGQHLVFAHVHPVSGDILPALQVGSQVCGVGNECHARNKCRVFTSCENGRLPVGDAFDLEHPLGRFPDVDPRVCLHQRRHGWFI